MNRYIIPISQGKALEVCMAEGKFDTCVGKLKANGLELITARQLAEARMLYGAYHPVTLKGSWVAENFNYLSNGDILVASKAFNPLLQYPSFAKQATDCHRQRKEFYLNDDIVSYLLEGAKHKDKVLQLKRKDVPNKISTDAFSKEPVTTFLFGDKAEEYGQFLRADGIKSVPLYVVDKASAKELGKAFSRVLWDSILCIDSGLFGYCDLSLFYSMGRVSGIRKQR